MKNFCFLLLFLLFIACQNKNKQDIAYVESTHLAISNSTIDQITKQDLYEKLYEIYLFRKEAIEEQIRISLLSRQKEESHEPIDSIISKYGIKINLKEPTSPFIPIKDKYIHWNGNLNSSTSLIEIVNPECDLCRIVAQKIDNLLKTSTENIKIGYVIYSSENTLSVQALSYASHKDKFKELFNDFMTSKNPLDTTTILNNMARHGLDTIEFSRNTLKLQEESLKQNIYIRNLGISKTPTILVNNKLIYNPLDTFEIRKKLSFQQ